MTNEQPDKVWGQVTATINIGNYENIKIEMGESKTIPPDDDTTKGRKSLRLMLIDDLLDQIEFMADQIRDDHRV